jgi:hypothetical protein
MQPNRPGGVTLRVLNGIVASVAVILLVFTIQLLVQLHDDVGQLRDELATKEELANLAVHLGPPDPTQTALEGSCTGCHTAEAFTAAHGLDEGVHDLVSRMNRLAGAHIDPAEIPRVEAALTFLKCAHCHPIDRLKELAILSPQERWDVILTMAEAPGGTISQEDAQRIRDFYGDFWGWHRR